MTEPVLYHGHVVYQTSDDDNGIAEAAVLVHADASGVIVLSQEGRDVVLNRASLREVWRAVRAVVDAVQKGGDHGE